MKYRDPSGAEFEFTFDDLNWLNKKTYIYRFKFFMWLQWKLLGLSIAYRMNKKYRKLLNGLKAIIDK